MKYPRTLHLPWSPGKTSDDKVANIESVIKLLENDIVITEKMDGECTTLGNQKMFARSQDSTGYGSKTKQLWGTIRHLIESDEFIVGENIEYVHSLTYPKDIYFFQVFNIYYENYQNTEKPMWCHWEDIENLCKSISECAKVNLPTVPLLFKGRMSIEELKDFTVDTKTKEGFVIRNMSSFIDFQLNVFKWVRENHVTTNIHWTKNKVKNGSN